MTISNKISTAFLAATLAVAGTTAAQADTKSSEVMSFLPSVLKVASNGKDYTKLETNATVKIGVLLQYDAATTGRIKSWQAVPTVKNGFGPGKSMTGLAIFKTVKSYPIGSRPKKINLNEVINIPSSVFEKEAVSMCNMQAALLSKQGKSDQFIFGVDRQVSFKVDVLFDADLTIGGSNVINEQSFAKDFTVICMRSSGTQLPSPGTVAAPVQIKKATMKLREVATLNGTCMVKLTTAISTSQPGATVKYRYVHSSGAKSNVMTVKTAANKIAVVKHDWDIPNGPGAESGWMRMDGVSPNFKSNQAPYRMTCKGGSVGGISSGTAKPGTTVRAK